jgi:hypothetical protein
LRIVSNLAKALAKTFVTLSNDIVCQLN